jgi:hypothetical protein
MPPTDWNWFFSSLAQSAAAIVGIFGAFIVTKILANQSAFAETSRRIRDTITLGDKLQDASSRLSFEWYHKHDSAGEFDDLEKLLEKEPELTPEDLYEKLRFSPYIARADAIQSIARLKTYREARIEREQAEARREAELARVPGFRNPMSRSIDSTLLRGVNVPILNHIRPQLTKEREEIDSLFTEARHHSRVATDLYAQASTNPESSGVITASLVLILALFFVGVIYPLSFMPLPTDWKVDVSLSAAPDFIFSLRGALLGAVAVLFTAMLAIFLVMNIKLRYPDSLLISLQKYKHLAQYSKYFENRRENALYRTAVEA